MRSLPLFSISTAQFGSSSSTHSPCGSSIHNISKSWISLTGSQHHPNSPCLWRVHCCLHFLCAFDSTPFTCLYYVSIRLIFHEHEAYLPLFTTSCYWYACSLTHLCDSLRREAWTATRKRMMYSPSCRPQFRIILTFASNLQGRPARFRLFQLLH